jgi:hypothetical protein
MVTVIVRKRAGITMVLVTLDILLGDGESGDRVSLTLVIKNIAVPVVVPIIAMPLIIVVPTKVIASIKAISIVVVRYTMI